MRGRTSPMDIVDDEMGAGSGNFGSRTRLHFSGVLGRARNFLMYIVGEATEEGRTNELARYILRRPSRHRGAGLLDAYPLVYAGIGILRG